MNQLTDGIRVIFSFLLISLSLITSSSFAQTEEDVLTTLQVEEIVNELAEQSIDHYIFADKGNILSEHYINKLNSNGYPLIATELALALQQDARELIEDKHFSITIVEPSQQFTPDVRFSPNYQKKINYGFKKLEILPGNIAYLKLDNFIAPQYEDAGLIANSAMSFLNNSDAFILDLRENGGGNPRMNQLIATYFFENTTSLSGIYYRDRDILFESNTLPSVPGRRMPDIPLYILTSSYTFSAAEAFAFDMQVTERATIVGEITGGGAHPVNRIPLTHGFTVTMPTGRAVNPNVSGNWEGEGVVPDIAVNEEASLDRAYLEALNALYNRAESESNKESLYNIIQELD